MSSSKGSMHAARKTMSANAPKKLHIMAVDDEEDILEIIRRYLELHNFEVKTYSDSSTALQEYKPNFYDLVILDIRMPGMNGFELYAKIKDVDPKVKVCFLTAFETYRQIFRDTFPELEEVKCYIKKPVSAAELLKHVETVLQIK